MAGFFEEIGEILFRFLMETPTKRCHRCGRVLEEQNPSESNEKEEQKMCPECISKRGQHWKDMEGIGFDDKGWVDAFDDKK